LQPLPSEHYVLAFWKTVRASIDYHVEVDRHYYSVPYQLAGQKLEARYTATTVEFFHGGKRVASHAHNSITYRHTTVGHNAPIGLYLALIHDQQGLQPFRWIYKGKSERRHAFK
jgi:transposase